MNYAKIQCLKITSIIAPKIIDQPGNFADLIQAWLILSGFAYVSAISRLFTWRLTDLVINWLLSGVPGMVHVSLVIQYVRL